MEEHEALTIARQRFGDAIVGYTPGGGCAIYVKDDGQYLTYGFGYTWEDALTDAVRTASFQDTYA